MKFTIRDVEHPACRSRMRNSQHRRTTNILIINQRASIETISDRDKAVTCQGMCQPFIVSLDARTINRTQAQNGTERLPIVALCIQNDLFGLKFGSCIKRVRARVGDCSFKYLPIRLTVYCNRTELNNASYIRANRRLDHPRCAADIDPFVFFRQFGRGLTMCRSAAR